MARSIYVASAEGHTGKSAIALGLVDLFARRVESVGIFRPVTRSQDERDGVVDLLRAHPGVDVSYDDALAVTYDDVHDDGEQALSRIIEAYQPIGREHEVTIVVGSDYTDVASPAELAFNARVAANLGAPVLLVVSGLDRTPDEIARLAEAAVAEIAHEHAATVGVLANRCDPDQLDAVRERLDADGRAAWALPEVPLLSAPVVRDLMAALDGELLLGDEALLDREAEHLLVAGMNTEHILERLREGQLCIAAADRPEVLVTLVAAHASDQFPTLAGIVLNGAFQPSEQVLRMVDGLGQRLPIISTSHDTYPSASLVAGSRGRFSRGTQRKRDIALSLFEEHMDAAQLLAALDVPATEVMTPLMFESRLLERARSDRRRIVLPEGEDDRILRAASTLLSRHVADLTLLGSPTQLRTRAAELGLDLDGADVVDPASSDLLEPFAQEYAQLRAHRGMTVERAREVVQDVSYFGTMMVHTGAADGMVSGAAHTTAHTIRPSFEIIKTRPETSIVSSVFFMCLADRVLVYGDCAVVPDPTAEELADIAISSAGTSAQFEVEPRVAMLSYSTGESGTGAEVDKVRTATELVRERRPDLVVEGPIQYDAAVDASVAAAKLPGSDVAGRATVFVFPDLNTGNNTYKAVQRTAGAVAVGPVLQGLNKPVNDLSRGALVQDIVNTVAITAVQAQQGAVQAREGAGA
ncbi:phosphate acetyltransferase [Georgenia halophila]|uniref:Phosphate acetyltransferase n=1 Tax=Georgenia halophila TaxID=620889 RepID=A0ABP8KVU5_9MICO